MQSIFRLAWIVLIGSGIGTLYTYAATTVAPEDQTPLVKNQAHERTPQSMDYQLA